MSEKVLITGEASFIGSHIADRLIDRGYEVVIYDNLDPQVHDGKPSYLNEIAGFGEGDIIDREKLRRILKEVNIVSHQAAGGTAALLDLIINEEDIEIEKLIVTRSMSIYGEGSYYCSNCEEYNYPTLCQEAQMKQGKGITNSPIVELRWNQNQPRKPSPLAPPPFKELLTFQYLIVANKNERKEET